VSDLDQLKDYLTKKVKNFKAGQLRYHIQSWEEITTDKEVLETISGLAIPVDKLPTMGLHPVNKKDNEKISQEINKLEKKGVIIQCKHESGEFISPVFLTPKSDGSSRMILNLKKLNSSIEKVKFKMHTLSSILCMIRPKMYMAKLDIKDAYYSIPIKLSDQKLLKFKHNDRLYKFVVLPNGYTGGPRKFTKAMKPPLAKLRKNKVSIADYIDDLLTMDSDFQNCLGNVHKVNKLLDELGFIIHPEKSIFIPSRRIEFLGHIINTVSMNITLTREKKEKIESMCQRLLEATTVTIREVARILGKFASSFLAAPYGRLHYRTIERFKIKALRSNRGNFDRYVKLPEEARKDIQWWRDNIGQSFSPIHRKNPHFEISSDASSFGWGASRNGTSTGGKFTQEEMGDHINILELKAALFALQSLCGSETNCHIL